MLPRQRTRLVSTETKPDHFKTAQNVSFSKTLGITIQSIFVREQLFFHKPLKGVAP
jgi:hypothetical protein